MSNAPEHNYDDSVVFHVEKKNAPKNRMQSFREREEDGDVSEVFIWLDSLKSWRAALLLPVYEQPHFKKRAL